MLVVRKNMTKIKKKANLKEMYPVKFGTKQKGKQRQNPLKVSHHHQNLLKSQHPFHTLTNFLMII